MGVKVKELWPGSWYLVVYENKQRRVRRVADNEEDAKRKARELEAVLKARGYEGLEGFRPHGKVYGVTVQSFAARWLAEIERTGLKRSTYLCYRGNIEKHIVPHFEGLPLADVTYLRAKEFIQDRLDAGYVRGGRRRQYSKDSIRLMVAMLRAMMEEAVREGLVEVNPVHGLGRFYGAARRLRDAPDPLTLDELHRIEDIAGEWLPFIMFLSRTGARVGEAIALQWGDLDLAKGYAWIRRTMPVHRQVGPPKTASSTRKVVLSPELVAVLTRLQKEQRETWFSRAESPLWVFCKKNRQAPDYSVFRRAWALLQRKAGVRERRVHDLRHTWASQQLLAGKPITWVAAQLGHKSPQVTLSVYSRWIPGEEFGARDTLDRQQNAAKGPQRTAKRGLRRL